MLNRADILMTGVGGQGVIMASDIISEVALAAGYDVKKTDSLGMAQRGGSVVSHIRLADEVFSPMIPPGGADFLVSYERLEALRSAAFLNPDSIAIIDSIAVIPLSVTIDAHHYPSVEEVQQSLSIITRLVHIVPATDMATELGNSRAASILSLGFLSVFLNLPESIWLDAIRRHLPPRLHQVNLAAFNTGVEAARRR